MSDSNNSRNYWRANLILVAILLTIWFVVGFVISIFYIESVNTARAFGWKMTCEQGACRGGQTRKDDNV